MIATHERPSRAAFKLTSPAELTVPTIGQTGAWMVMHKHGWEWVKMHGNDSWRRPRGHGVIHSTTAGSWAEWFEFSPSQRSFAGDTVTFSEQTSWHYEALKPKRLRRAIKLQYEHVRNQNWRIMSWNLNWKLNRKFWVKCDLQWTTFELHSGNALPYPYPIFCAILYPIFLLYTLYLFYSQHSVCYILYLYSIVYLCPVSVYCILLYPTYYILYQYFTSNILYAIFYIQYSINMLYCISYI